jgi:hypothetical protein
LAYFKIVDKNDDQEKEIKHFNPPLEIEIKYPAGLWKNAVDNINHLIDGNTGFVHPRAAYLGRKNLSNWAGSWVEFSYSGAVIKQPIIIIRPGSLKITITTLGDPLIGGC